MGRDGSKGWVRGVALGLICLGCTKSVPIQPSELPKLNGSFQGPMVGNGQLVAVRVAQVEAPDGTLVEVKGEFDAHITLKGGKELVFDHPVRALAVDGGKAIAIAGGNQAERVIPLAEIATVEVTHYDSTGTMLAGIFVSLGAIAGAVGVVLVLYATGV